MRNRHGCLKPLTVWHGRSPGKILIIIHIIRNPPSRGQGDVVTNLNMPGNSGLATKDTMFANDSASSYTDLGDQKSILTNLHIVCNLYKVINFYTTRDPGDAQSTAINATAGSNLNIILNNNVSNLRNLIVALTIRGETVAIRTNNSPGLDYYPVANYGFFTHGNVCIEQTIITNHNVCTNDHIRVEMGSFTNSGTGTNNAARLNGDILTDDSIRMDMGTLLDTRPDKWRYLKKIQNFSKGQVRVVSQKQRNLYAPLQ